MGCDGGLKAYITYLAVLFFCRTADGQRRTASKTRKLPGFGHRATLRVTARRLATPGDTVRHRAAGRRCSLPCRHQGGRIAKGKGPWLKPGRVDGASGGARPQGSGGCSPRDPYMRPCPQFQPSLGLGPADLADHQGLGNTPTRPDQGLSLGRAQWLRCAHPPPQSLSCPSALKPLDRHGQAGLQAASRLDGD